MSSESKSPYSYSSVNKIIYDFTRNLPEIFARHSLTSDLSIKLYALNLEERFNERFNVAIMGQMRVGKSMLLNALIGKELAPVGIEETTATVNWFRYGKGERCNTFRVNWTDGSSEDFNLDQVSEWVGRSENIRKTKSLDFFAQTNFLRTSNIIDTPGTRSVIDEHEGTTQGFLAEELEKASYRFGGKADAIIYAINPVARENDEKLLQLFGENSRLPGASATNSIAVVQKWEHFSPNPIAEVEQKCLKLQKILDGKVSHVIPTSGLMANYSRTLSDRVLHHIISLTSTASLKEIEYLVRFDDDFIEENETVKVPVADRKEILNEISFAVLPLILFESKNRGLRSANQVRDLLYELSGLPKLKSILNNNFFQRSWLIKASSSLQKIWEPSAIALVRLNNEIDYKQSLRKTGQESILKIKDNPEFRDIFNFIKEADKSLYYETKKMNDSYSEIDNFKYRAERAISIFEGDINAIDFVENNKHLFDEAESQQLLILLGNKGTEKYQRLNIDEIDISKEDELNIAEELFEYYSYQRSASSGELQIVYSHAVEILTQILNDLED